MFGLFKDKEKKPHKPASSHRRENPAQMGLPVEKPKKKLDLKKGVGVALETYEKLTKEDVADERARYHRLNEAIKRARAGR